MFGVRRRDRRVVGLVSLIAGFLTPHPPVIVPEVGGERLADVRATVEAMQRLTEEAAALDPEVIVVVSPHAPLHMHHMGASAATAYAGSFAPFGAPRSRVSVLGDAALALDIVRRGGEAGVPVQTLDAGREAELDHGALVPLWFLTAALPHAARVVVLSFSYLDRQAHVDFGRAVGDALRADRRRVIFVASSDLSHRLLPGAPAGYRPAAADFDRMVTEAFVAGDLESLAEIPRELVQEAGECGLRSLFVLSGVLLGMEWHPRLLSYEGPFGVGYLVGAVDINGAGANEDALVALARSAVEAHVLGRDPVEIPASEAADAERAGVFVSLHLPDGALRGCIGTFRPTRPTLADEIAYNAVSAAVSDPRFPPVRPEELAGLRVAVDVLGEPEEVEGLEQLDPSRYGIIVRTDDGRQALLLPDLEGVESADHQLRITCRKGNIHPERDTYRIYRFEVIRHGRH
ncbi:MAG: AmmeMemoRadiSam system protein A [Thermoleophilia bacterium]